MKIAKHNVTLVKKKLKMLELTSNLWDTVEVTDANGWYDLIFPETEGMAKGEPYYLSVVIIHKDDQNASEVKIQMKIFVSRKGKPGISIIWHYP